MIKKPDVAGLFYPDDQKVLSDYIQQNLMNAPDIHIDSRVIVAPHAGYQFSGPIAATSYKLLKNKKDVRNIVLLSPAHRYPLEGVAYHQADYFSTPMGTIKVNKKKLAMAHSLPFVREHSTSFHNEHGLEVHLPFIQIVAPQASIIPFVVGRTNIDHVTQLLNLYWDDPSIFFIISSDLSHFHKYDHCQKLDGQTSKWIQNLEYEKITGEHACGFYALRGLLKFMKDKNYKGQILDVRNSGDTSGHRDEVVGYGSFSFYEKK